ncbi:DNA polymerase III subunit delta [bacterium]|nr:DNA polymerase III subunit delta [bacterium]
MAKSHITPSEFKKHIKSGSLSPVYFAAGKEVLLLDEVLRIAKNSILAEETRDFNLDVFQGDSLTPEQLSSALNALPMMADKRVVILKKIESINDSFRKYLLGYFKNPAPETVFVMLFDGESKAAWVKKFQEAGEYIRCETPKGSQLESWIRRTVKSFEVGIEDDALVLMMEEPGLRLIDLEAELQKASLFINKGENITAHTIQQVWGVSPEIDIWKFFDNIAAGVLPEAAKEYRLQSGDSDRVIGQSISQVSRRHRMASKEKKYEQKRIPYQMRKWSGRTEFQWRYASNEVKKLSATFAEVGIEKALILDRKRKSISVSPSNLFELYIHQLAQAKRRLR